MAANPWDGKLHIDLTPYVWLPGINASIRYPALKVNLPSGVPGGGGPLATDGSYFDEEIGPKGYLGNTNFALMGYGTVRMGNVALYTDVLNANVSGTASRTRDFTGPFGDRVFSLTATDQTQAVTTLFTIAPSYTLYHAKATSLDLMVGGQFAWISTNAGLQLTTGNQAFRVGASAKANFDDFIVGLYGQVGLGGHFSVPYYVDSGFGTPTTWQYKVGLKYGNLELGWRYLQFNAASEAALVQHLDLGGATLGYTLHL